MDCRVELKKHVLPVLRRPLYLGLDKRALDTEDARDEEVEPAERALRNDCGLSEPDAGGVYGWRRDAACKPGLSMSL